MQKLASLFFAPVVFGGAATASQFEFPSSSYAWLHAASSNNARTLAVSGPNADADYTSGCAGTDELMTIDDDDLIPFPHPPIYPPHDWDPIYLPYDGVGSVYTATRAGNSSAPCTSAAGTAMIAALPASSSASEIGTSASRIRLSASAQGGVGAEGGDGSASNYGQAIFATHAWGYAEVPFTLDGGGTIRVQYQISTDADLPGPFTRDPDAWVAEGYWVLTGLGAGSNVEGVEIFQNPYDGPHAVGGAVEVELGPGLYTISVYARAAFGDGHVFEFGPPPLVQNFSTEWTAEASVRLNVTIVEE